MNESKIFVTTTIVWPDARRVTVPNHENIPSGYLLDESL